MTPDIFDRPAYVYKVWSPLCEGVYFGMTLDPAHRWHTHKGALRPRSIQRNNPLYVAMRQIGRTKFRFTILKKWDCKFAAAAHERELMIGAIADGVPLFNKSRPKGWREAVLDRARARMKAKGDAK